MALPLTVGIYEPPKDLKPALTNRQVVDWYISQPGALGTSKASATERERILTLFAASYGHHVCDFEHSTPDMLDDFVNAQPRIRAQNTRKRWYSTVLTAFSYAAKRRKIERNPFSGPEIPTGEEGRDLTAAEFQAVMRLAHVAYRRVLVFLRETGCRPGEMRAILPSDIDLDNRRIVLAKHKTRNKTKRPRVIYLSVCAVKLVEWLLRRAMPGVPLFLNSKGRRWSNQALTKNFGVLRERAGLPEDAVAYGLRHAFATRLLGDGESEAVVAELMGHSGTQTLKRYCHLANKNAALLDALDGRGRKR